MVFKVIYFQSDIFHVKYFVLIFNIFKKLKFKIPTMFTFLLPLERKLSMRTSMKSRGIIGHGTIFYQLLQSSSYY